VALPKVYNPALAKEGDPTTQRFGRPRGELDQKIVELLSGQDEPPSLEQATAAPPGQKSGSVLGEVRSMDWRARAAELMRRQMTERSNEQERPAWMRQRG